MSFEGVQMHKILTLTASSRRDLDTADERATARRAFG